MDDSSLLLQKKGPDPHKTLFPFSLLYRLHSPSKARYKDRSKDREDKENRREGSKRKEELKISEGRKRREWIGEEGGRYGQGGGGGGVVVMTTYAYLWTN